MTPINSGDYPAGKPARDVLLGGLGFDASGHRGGGVNSPITVTLPTGALLLRLHKKTEPGERSGEFGAWWFTAHEFDRISSYFGVSWDLLIQDRQKGRSMLHGVLALLSEWYGGSAGQIGLVKVVRLKSPLLALYGEGAPANAAGYDRTLKPVTLQDGKTARQIYIHQCWDYSAAMVPVGGNGNYPVDDLPKVVATASWSKLPFE